MAYDISPNGLASVRSRWARLATLWEIERTDGTVLRFTDHDRNITFDDETFSPVSGLSASARQKQPELKNQNLEAVGVIDDDAITHDDLRAGKYVDAKVTERLVDWGFPFAAIFVAVYWIESMKFTGEHWEASLAGITRRLRSKRGQLYNRTCRWQHGGTECGISLASYTAEDVTVGTVVSSRLEFQSDETGEADDYYNYGLITWVTGDNAGFTSEVKDYTASNGVFELQLKTPYDIEAGDTFDVHAGCDRLAATCKDKYSNLVNFGGFPFIPGNDKMLETPNS